MLKQFTVHIYSNFSNTTHSICFRAENFAHAEEQALPYVAKWETMTKIEAY